MAAPSLVEDQRFTVPRYTVAEAAALLRVPSGTFEKWVNGYRFIPKGRSAAVEGKPIIHAEPPRPGATGRPRLSFGSLTEGMVIEGLRRAGLHLTDIRRITKTLRTELGGDWALASRRLYVSGPDVLWNHAEKYDDLEAAELVVLKSGQRVFTEAVLDYLDRITYDDEGEGGYARRLYPPIVRERIIEVDARRAFGDPVFVHGGARVEDVIDRLQAGEPPEIVAEDFRVPLSDLVAVERAFGGHR